MGFKPLNLREVTVSEREEKMLVEAMSNWPKLHKALQDDDLFDLEMVRKAIKVELKEKRRVNTLSRLAGKYKHLLARAVDEEIFK